ncbi:hypothetical protein IJH02_01690 [Candidatus Saccharibacteria bacterium]|nr:hypothetical protein [Candidatus Saccharibacteria bacterium]
MENNQNQNNPAPQTYSEPLVVKTSLTRFFIGLGVACVSVSLISFILSRIDVNNDVVNTLKLVFGRINDIAIFARIACLGFATAATIIKVLNPHPYNTKTMIAAWATTIAIGLALIIFR